MLQQIYVKNFVLIDELTVSFEDHMTAFTGETGAGKSLLIDAIKLLMGERIQNNYLKTGEKEALVEGVFYFNENHAVTTLLKEIGMNCEDSQLIIARSFSNDNKSIARINHQAVNANFLKRIVPTLIDIHSQNDTQYLLQKKHHILLLDAFINDKKTLVSIQKTFQEYQDALHTYEEFLNTQITEEDIEFYEFQLQEINDCDPQDNELAQLLDEQKQMLSFETVYEKSNRAIALLEEETGSVDHLYEACKSIESLSEDTFFLTIHDQLLDNYYQINEQLTRLKDHITQLSFDKNQYQRVNERISQLQKIFRKYGGTYQSCMSKKNEILQKIEQSQNHENYQIKLAKKCHDAMNAFKKAAAIIHQKRVQKASLLETLIIEQLHDLHLEHAQFKIEITNIEGNTLGCDDVEFLIAMNKGETLKPLHKSVSGGEKSRFMLGLKCVFNELQGIETIIFDEIDSGVSGKVAFAVGQKMRALAKKCQVFAVTHLSQVAASAQHHKRVEKIQANKTSTTITTLTTAEKIQELAMISSNSKSEAALKAAQELLTSAQK